MNSYISTGRYLSAIYPPPLGRVSEVSAAETAAVGKGALELPAFHAVAVGVVSTLASFILMA
jgi:hypothetical protein